MVERSLPFRTGGMPPPGRGIPLSGRSIPLSGRGIPPARRDIPPADRGIPPGVQLMIQAGRGMTAATGEVLDARNNLNLIRNLYTHNTSIVMSTDVMSTDVMSTDRANNRPRTEEVLTNFRVNLTVPTTITNNVLETPMRTLNVSRRNVPTSNVSRRNWRVRITPYSRVDSANQRFLPR